MNKLLLDNSAFSIMNCARKYQLTCIEGRRVPPDKNLLYGSAQHRALELEDNGRDFITDVLPAVCAEFGESFAAKLTAMSSVVRNQVQLPAPITINGRPAVEIKFSWHYTTIHDYEIHLCGTIDKIYHDAKNDLLVFADYKTTGAATPSYVDSVKDEYTTSFQLPFYLYNLKYCPGILPAAWREYLLSDRYRQEVWLLLHNFNPMRTALVSHGPWPPDFIDREIESIIRHKCEEAVRIAELSGPAPHTGFTVYKACTNCSFRPGCISVGTARELEYHQRFEQAPYNPLTFR